MNPLTPPPPRACIAANGLRCRLQHVTGCSSLARDDSNQRCAQPSLSRHGTETTCPWVDRGTGTKFAAAIPGHRTPHRHRLVVAAGSGVVGLWVGCIRSAADLASLIGHFTALAKPSLISIPVLIIQKAGFRYPSSLRRSSLARNIHQTKTVGSVPRKLSWEEELPAGSK